MELIRHKWITSNEILLARICLVLAREYELSIQLSLVLIEHLAKLNFHIAFFVKNTLLRDILWRCALKGSTDLETSKDFSHFILRVTHITTNICDNLFQCLLCSTCYPATRLANLIKSFYQRLELQQQVTVCAYELAHLIDKEQNTEIAVLLTVDVLLHLCRKCLNGNVHVIIKNTSTNHIGRKCRVNLLCHIKGKIKATSSKTRYVAFPIISLVLHIVLELLELAVIVKSFLQILSKGKIKRVITPLSIELIPENGCEGCFLVGIHIMNVTDVEHYHFNISLRYIPTLQSLQL